VAKRADKFLSSVLKPEDRSAKDPIIMVSPTLVLI
jgi:hypothetical protein